MIDPPGQPLTVEQLLARPGVDHRLGARVIVGFVLVFAATWIVNALLGVGVNQALKWLGASVGARLYLGSTLSYGGRLAAVVWLSAVAYRRVLGWNPWPILFPLRAGWWKDLLRGLLLAAAVMLLLFAVETAAGWLVVEGWNWRGSPDAWLRNVWLALLINGFVAVGEETLYRGYLLSGLERAWGKWIGLAVMAILFSLPHLTVAGAGETNSLLFVLSLALPGLLLGWAFLRSRSLWLPIGLHFAWNAMQDDVLNLSGKAVPSLVGAITRQQGPAWFVGTAYGIEVGLAGILAVLLVGAGVWFWTGRGRQARGG
jgi:membrane protease YdiL (CAAX protease family)